MPVDELDCELDDRFYVAGAIELTLGNLAIITRVEEELVDQLWSYLVDKTEGAFAGRSVHTYFPDQPIKLEVVPHGRGTLLLELTYPGVERAAEIEASAFVAELQRAGRLFLTQIARFSTENAQVAREEIGYLDALTTEGRSP